MKTAVHSDCRKLLNLDINYFHAAPHQTALGWSVQGDRYMDEVKRLVKVKKLIKILIRNIDTKISLERSRQDKKNILK